MARRGQNSLPERLNRRGQGRGGSWDLSAPGASWNESGAWKVRPDEKEKEKWPPMRVRVHDGDKPSSSPRSVPSLSRLWVRARPGRIRRRDGRASRELQLRGRCACCASCWRSRPAATRPACLGRVRPNARAARRGLAACRHCERGCVRVPGADVGATGLHHRGRSC